MDTTLRAWQELDVVFQERSRNRGYAKVPSNTGNSRNNGIAKQGVSEVMMMMVSDMRVVQQFCISTNTDRIDVGMEAILQQIAMVGSNDDHRTTIRCFWRR